MIDMDFVFRNPSHLPLYTYICVCVERLIKVWEFIDPGDAYNYEGSFVVHVVKLPTCSVKKKVKVYKRLRYSTALVCASLLQGGPAVRHIIIH